MTYYAGIGSRETPPAVQKQMQNIARNLAEQNLTLRSGGAKGADHAFEQGCDFVKGTKEIFTAKDDIPEWAFEMFRKFHPAPERCSEFVRRLHARNAMILFGKESPGLWYCGYGRGENPIVKFIVCWTPEGKVSGGTGQAMRIAKHYSIPIINLFGNGDVSQIPLTEK